MARKKPVDSNIGQRLKEYRQLRGMTVRELADAAHVTPGQISHYEHGRDRISHERVTEFARILRIKSNDLYEPPGSQLRRNHVRRHLLSFMAAVIAQAAALMSSRRQAAADNEATEATMVAAVAIAVGASAAAASDAGAGEKSSLTTSADDSAVANPTWHRMAETVTDKEKIIVVEGKLESSGAVSETIFRADAETTLQLAHVGENARGLGTPGSPWPDNASDAANALLVMHGAHTDTINLPGHYTINSAESQGQGGKVAYDPPMSAAGEQASAQSTSAENGSTVSNPFLFAETASGNKDHSALQFKPSMDHHAVTDPKINDITKEHPEHPAHPHSDNFKFADNDDHPGKASHDHSKINDIANDLPPQHTADNSSHMQRDDDGSPASTDGSHPGRGQGDGSQSDSPNFADNGSPHSAHATGEDTSVPSTRADNGHHPIADPEINLASIAPNQPPEHPADNLPPMPAQPDDGPHPAVDVNEVPSFKFADGADHPGTITNDPTAVTAPSNDSSGTHGPAAPTLAKTDVPDAGISAAQDQFVFADNAGHGPVADRKPDVIEIDPTVPADVQHLSDIANEMNAVSALDPNRAAASQDMTKVQLPHHHDDFHFA